MVDLLTPIFLTIITVGLALIMNRFYKVSVLTHKRIDFIDKRIEYLILLIDTAGSGLCSPMHRAIYDKLRSMDPEEALEAARDKNSFLREVTSEGYAKTREVLAEIRNKTDNPDKKKEYDTALEELDGIFNLLSTIGKDSDPEHVQKIMDNVAMSISKMRQKGLDISIEGLDF